MNDAQVKLLIVDDRPENLLTMENVLHDVDCQIFKAKSGQEALRLAWQHVFALILLDVQMPCMDGFEVAELMRGNAKTKDTPIIFVTADKDKRDVARFMSVGVTGFLFKPIDPDILKSKVNVFINLQKHKIHATLHRPAARS